MDPEFAASPKGRRILPPCCSKAGMDYNEFRRLIDWIHPAGKFPGYSCPRYAGDHSSREAEWIARQLTCDSNSRGAFLVGPDDDPEWVRGEVRRLGLSGLKCYHLLASRQPAWEADIPDYLPERIVAVANAEGWAITLHMVKSKAVADPVNQYWIRHYCERYPGIKLILAHGARVVPAGA